MAPIQVFVFLDFGCVKGDPEKLTEVSLLAVPSSQILQPQKKEEPQDKLTLNLRKSGFDMDLYKKINGFLNRQKPPVCLVVHNGHRFDFIVLKKNFQKLNVSLSDDLLCADSLYAFYDILREKHGIIDCGNKLMLKFESTQSNQQAMTEQDTSKAKYTQENESNKNKVCHDVPEEQLIKGDLDEEKCNNPSTSNVNRTCQTNDIASVATIDDVKKDHSANEKDVIDAQGKPNQNLESDNMQQQNEKTPKKRSLDATSLPIEYIRKKCGSNALNTSIPGNAKRKLNLSDDKHFYNGSPTRNIYYENNPKPAEKYRLGAIYDRIIKYPPVEHHPAANDVYMQFRISHILGERFLAWTDQIQFKFSAVKIKEIVFKST